MAVRRPRKVKIDQILARDGNKCWLCGNPIDMSLPLDHPLAASIEHVVPVSRGGSRTSPFNCGLAHRQCNSVKSDKPAWEFFGNIEGLLYKEEGNSAILLTFESDDELFSVLNKLVHTRDRHLKRVIQNLMRRLD